MKLQPLEKLKRINQFILLFAAVLIVLQKVFDIFPNVFLDFLSGAIVVITVPIWLYIDVKKEKLQKEKLRFAEH